jgi:hypothetical protein
MSYCFGFTLQKHAILVSDKQRTEYREEGVRRILETKIWKLRDDLFIAAAGMLYFADDMAKRVLPQVVQDKQIRREALESYLSEWAEFFDRSHSELERHHIQQLCQFGHDPNVQREMDTLLLLAGRDADANPFLLGFHSKEHFKPAISWGSFKYHVPVSYPDERTTAEDVRKFNETILQMFKRRHVRLFEMSDETARVKRALKIMPEIIAFVSQKNSAVSNQYDIAVVGPNGSSQAGSLGT